MILSDNSIKKAISSGDIIITPYSEDNIGSNSYDLHLSKHLAVYEGKILDCKNYNVSRRFEIPENGIMLMPNELYLASTIECTSTLKYVPCIEGKSSIARLGIQVHLTAGFGDVGFNGHWTLEIIVTKPVIVYAGMPICQIYYQEVSGLVDNTYNQKKNAKYSNQGHLPQTSKMFKNF